MRDRRSLNYCVTLRAHTKPFPRVTMHLGRHFVALELRSKSHRYLSAHCGDCLAKVVSFYMLRGKVDEGGMLGSWPA